MLLLERGYQIPDKAAKKAYLIEKNMPADKLLARFLKQAEEERKEWYSGQYFYYEERIRNSRRTSMTA